MAAQISIHNLGLNIDVALMTIHNSIEKVFYECNVVRGSGGVREREGRGS